MTMSLNVAFVWIRLWRVVNEDGSNEWIFCDPLSEMFPTWNGVRDLKIDRVPSTPKSDDVTDTEGENASHVGPLRSLRPISQWTYDNNEDERDIKLRKKSYYKNYHVDSTKNYRLLGISQRLSYQHPHSRSWMRHCCSRSPRKQASKKLELHLVTR